MQATQSEYRGFAVTVNPFKGDDDLWDFEYLLEVIGDTKSATARGAIRRTQTADGYATAEIACMAGLEVAKTEIDNRIALQS